MYLKCQGFSLQHIQYIDSSTQLMNFIGFPPFHLLLHHANVGNEMEVYWVIKSLFPHLWWVLPSVLIPGTDSMNEQNGDTLCICCHLMAACCALQSKCLFNVPLPYLLL